MIARLEGGRGGEMFLNAATVEFDWVIARLEREGMKEGEGEKEGRGNTLTRPHSEHRFSAPSSKLCQI